MSITSGQIAVRRGDVELVAIVGLMVVVGLAGWKLSERPRLAVDTLPLAALPQRIGPWQSVDVPMEPAVESELRADFNLQRVYVSPDRSSLVLYVGYYGTLRGGRPEHTPQGCYTGAGWGIESARTLAVGGPGEAMRMNEYVVEREGSRQLIVFWYRSFRRTGLLGGLDQNVDRLVGLMLSGRADGALVRLSTLVEGDDVVGARSRLQSFASLVDPLLRTHWPAEFACDGDDRSACARPAVVTAERS